MAAERDPLIDAFTEFQATKETGLAANVKLLNALEEVASFALYIEGFPESMTHTIERDPLTGELVLLKNAVYDSDDSYQPRSPIVLPRSILQSASPRQGTIGVTAHPFDSTIDFSNPPLPHTFTYSFGFSEITKLAVAKDESGTPLYLGKKTDS